ncbi:MAG: HAMP domain-containing histidine kinase [Rubrivivax sp.]|nr:HAMP domain-containing histidine kinase [Rubrivivax sp.]
MKSLYLRIWLTVVAALALFAALSGWLVQRHLERERSGVEARIEQRLEERMQAWGELLQRSLPAADAPAEVQAEALLDWSARLRLPLALDDAEGRRIAASPAFERIDRRFGPGRWHEESAPGGRGPMRGMPSASAIRLDDGRTLWLARPVMALPRHGSGPPGAGIEPPPRWPAPRGLFDGLGLAALLLVLLAAVAAGAWPVVRRLTRRLEALQRGVEAFGAGALDHRVAVEGRDEVASLAAAFNRTAGRIEALVRSHRSLLANASHELRSPLARLKMALAMLDDAPAGRRDALRREIAADIAELDALVEEVLLSSRLDAAPALDRREHVDLLALATEEGARVQAAVDGEPVAADGDERLLRRALRNLLENARRYGGGDVSVRVGPGPSATVEVRVCDRGPGVPEALRERIFEPFFRLPGHAEREGGVGLGLALVRQIAERHGGTVRCEPRDGGGSCFVLALPAAAPVWP